MDKKLLVVDDEESIRTLLQRAFELDGIQSVAAVSAEAALEALEKEDFQVFFLDLLLPGMNGVELCRKIRKSHPTAAIYAMTGYSAVFDRVRCREAGFDDYFAKPFDIPQIVQTAKEAFERLERLSAD